MPTLLTNIYSPIPYFAIIIFIILFARTPLFSATDTVWHEKNLRTSTIDGLRGFLAISVFFHHAAITYHYLLTNSWELPPSVFYTQLGQASVSLFFMITGYLFWGKAIRAQGRLPWKNLYIGRLFRIGPLYYLATICMLFIVAADSNFTFHQPFIKIIKETWDLLLLGFFYPGEINGYQNPGLILAGVTWTLRYEWLFYLFLLPVAAIFARLSGRHIWFSILGYLFCLTIVFLAHATHQSHGSTSLAAMADFFAGMATASIQHKYSFNIKRNSYIQSLVVGLLALSLLYFQTAFAFFPIIILTLIFFLVSSGCSFFGLLNARSPRRLGEISYGIYILQGIALYLAFNYAPFRQFALESVLHYWIVTALAGIALVSMALLAHITLEMPGIKIGRYFIKLATQS